jgi:hypothetical protein
MELQSAYEELLQEMKEKDGQISALSAKLSAIRLIAQ